MSRNKKIIIAISIILVIIVIIIISIMLVNTKKEAGTLIEKSSGTVETVPEPEMDLEYSQKELREPTEFFSVEECIKNNIDENFVAKRMNYLQGNNVMTYSVEGILNNTTKYFIVRVDMRNMAFKIEEIEDGKYNSLDEIKLEDNEANITSNENNSFKYEAVSDENMCRRYLEDFKQKELNNPEEAYELLDEDGNLTLSMEEIANFYRTFEGYHYALDDTMYDILADVGGGLFGCLSCAVVFHFYPQLQDKIIYRPVENEVLYGEEEKTADRKNN